MSTSLDSSAELTNSAKTANRAHLTYKDVTEADDYLAAIQYLDATYAHELPHEMQRIRDGLFIAAVVVYSRSFKSSNSSKADRKMDINQLPHPLSAEELRMHEKILHARDKAVAHSDEKFHNTALISADHTARIRRSSLGTPWTAEVPSIVEFRKLAEHVRNSSHWLSDTLDKETIQATQSNL